MIESITTREKVGVFAQYLDSRNDVRDLINDLSRSCNVVLFLKSADAAYASHFSCQIEIRFFNPVQFKYANYVISRLYKIFGRLPRSRRNYFITERFKIRNSQYNKAQYKFESALISLSSIAPRLLSYDTYLSLIRKNYKIQVDDIDVFYCVTQIYDDSFYSYLQQTKKKVFNYVYSWDHPCKMKCFSKGKNNYFLVWSESIKTDLVQLHYIDSSQIKILGATQLIYLNEYISESSEQRDIPSSQYIYLVFATGTDILIKQEIELFEQIIKKLTSCIIDINFLIRPYPFVKDWQVYDRLGYYENVTIEADYREYQDSFLVSKQQLLDKYKKVQQAAAFIHFGTTLGLEASFLNTPVFFAALATGKNYKELNEFIHQYQNDKYLNLKHYPNVVKSIDELALKIIDTLKSPDKYCEYNKRSYDVAIPESLSAITSRLTNYFFS